MAEVKRKPLNWIPQPGIGFTVVRRLDGGMHFTFTDLDRKTLEAWRGFALQHLMDAEGPTRNLYDLRAVGHIPDHAIQFAVEANSDPAARHIRLAVVVTNDDVAAALRKVDALTALQGVGTEMGLFTNLTAAEEWLNKPFSPLLR
ncbi:MAG: hypothetical protein ACE5FI_00980 [Anaerolineales bacterium]